MQVALLSYEHVGETLVSHGTLPLWKTGVCEAQAMLAVCELGRQIQLLGAHLEVQIRWKFSRFAFKK